jgi:hypothetical protein
MPFCGSFTLYTPGFTAHLPEGDVVTQLESINPTSTVHEFFMIGPLQTSSAFVIRRELVTSLLLKALYQCLINIASFRL